MLNIDSFLHQLEVYTELWIVSKNRVKGDEILCVMMKKEGIPNLNAYFMGFCLRY